MPDDARPTCTFFDFPGDDKLFPTPHASDFDDFVRECVDFYHRHPEIERMILEDQRRHALEAKHQRARATNDEWVATLPLEGFEDLDADLGACSVQLGVGRPRTHPVAVFVFLMIRCRSGGPCHRQTWDLVVESQSLEAVLAPYCRNLPGRTTILENLNVLSDATMEAIQALQLADARGEGLDDFEKIAVDSTAVKASSAWPTDSKTIRDLCGRYLRAEKRLRPFGFDPGGNACCLRWEEQLDGLHKAIGMAGSGTSAPARRKRLYREFYLTGCTLLDALIKRHKRLLEWLGEASMPPLRKERARELTDAMGVDVLMACETLEQSIGRVEEGKMPKTRERVLGECYDLFPSTPDDLYGIEQQFAEAIRRAIEANSEVSHGEERSDSELSSLSCWPFLLDSRKDPKTPRFSSSSPLIIRLIPSFIKAAPKLSRNPSFNSFNFRYVKSCL